MGTQNKLMTAEELLALPGDGCRYELVKGELRRMPPAGEEHGDIAGKLHGFLFDHVWHSGLGKVYAAETGFQLRDRPDTVRAPDVAFVSRERLEEQPPSPGYRKGAPDLAVEVISPHDRAAEVAEKVYEWLHYGAREVWVVDPAERTVSVYRSADEVQRFTGLDALTSKLFPGWQLPLEQLFS
jgi:Uma2 family endonuclease